MSKVRLASPLPAALPRILESWAPRGKGRRRSIFHYWLCNYYSPFSSPLDALSELSNPVPFDVIQEEGGPARSIQFACYMCAPFPQKLEVTEDLKRIVFLFFGNFRVFLKLRSRVVLLAYCKCCSVVDPNESLFSDRSRPAISISDNYKINT